MTLITEVQEPDKVLVLALQNGGRLWRKSAHRAQTSSPTDLISSTPLLVVTTPGRSL
jgi:hypothetical protein